MSVFCRIDIVQDLWGIQYRRLQLLMAQDAPSQEVLAAAVAFAAPLWKVEQGEVAPVGQTAVAQVAVAQVAVAQKAQQVAVGQEQAVPWLAEVAQLAQLHLLKKGSLRPPNRCRLPYKNGRLPRRKGLGRLPHHRLWRGKTHGKVHWWSHPLTPWCCWGFWVWWSFRRPSLSLIVFHSPRQRQQQGQKARRHGYSGVWGRLTNGVSSTSSSFTAADGMWKSDWILGRNQLKLREADIFFNKRQLSNKKIEYLNSHSLWLFAGRWLCFFCLSCAWSSLSVCGANACSRTRQIQSTYYRILHGVLYTAEQVGVAWKLVSFCRPVEND